MSGVASRSPLLTTRWESFRTVGYLAPPLPVQGGWRPATKLLWPGQYEAAACRSELKFKIMMAASCGKLTLHYIMDRAQAGLRLPGL